MEPVVEDEPTYDPCVELKAAHKVIQDQKAQLRDLMEAYSNQIHWAEAWRIQCHDNIRLRAILKSKEEGTEVMELKQRLIDTTAELATYQAAYQQRGILLSNTLQEVCLLTAENQQLRGSV